MDRKKKRGKHSGSTAAEAESTSDQPGDVHLWQREAESAKKLAVGGGPNSDSPTQPSLPLMPWSYTQHLLAQHIFKQPVHTAMPQPPIQLQQQATAQHGQQSVTQQPLPPGQPSRIPEVSGQSTVRGHYPFHSVSADSNHDSVHNLGSTTAPHNFPGGYAFPPPPHPGHWDLSTWWMYHMQQQAFYPYSFPGCIGIYPYPIPAPSVGTNQRGFIKAPPGLSQKHCQLWEMQSTENMQLWATTMQLWATVARTEAEVSCQRDKILKLEGDLQTMRAHRDALLEASKGRAVPQQAGRGRAKRTAAAPVAIVGLPASQPSPQVRKARGSLSKVDIPKDIKDHTEAKPINTHVDNIPEVINRFTRDQNEKSSSGLNRIESGTDANSHKDMVGSQQEINDKICAEMANVNSRHDSQNSLRPNLLAETVKESYGKEACIPRFLKTEANKAKQGAISGDCNIKSELTGMSRRDGWSEANGIDGARKALLGGLLHAQYGSDTLGRSNATSSGKVVPDWHYVLEDGSDAEEEAVMSGQDDEAAEEIDETPLDGINGGKMSNYIVLNPATEISKELMTLGRWRV